METNPDPPAAAAAAAAGEPVMELPECPVCLQSYDEISTVPRVLPCGHSACDLCLSLLPSPPAHPNTVRCPACNQLARFPSPLGPKSLPKNIDLLRFCSLYPDPVSKPYPQDKSGSKTKPDLEFLPRPWTDDFLQAWTHWILPPQSISLVEPTVDPNLVLGIHSMSTGRENQQQVSLFPLYVSSNEPKWFRFSYMPKVMESVCQLEERVRAQLKFLLDVCSRQRSGICQVLGLWMNPDEKTSPLFLVCERFNQTLTGILNGEGNWRLGLETVEKFGFGIIWMELCEVVMSFHSKGVIFGCLDMDCFSFDTYGHCLLDLNNVFVKAKRLCRDIEDKNPNSSKTQEFLSPEVFVALHEGSFTVDYGSDVWSLGCILAMILVGDAKLAKELFEDFYFLFLTDDSGKFADACLRQFEVWREKVICKLESLLVGTKFESLLQILSSSLQYQLESRPQVRDIWCCIKRHFFEIPADSIAAFDEFEEKKYKENLVSCLFIGNMSYEPKEVRAVSQQQGNSIISETVPEVGLAESSRTNMDQLHKEQVDGDFAKGLQCGGFQFDTLQGHHDCITGLAVGGGYLFSSSFDKTVSVWSLQDYSLACTMTGHTSTVSSLAVANGVLYSGSWDGTIRLWCLGDHSLLSVLGDDTVGVFVPILSLSVDSHFLVSAYENGCIKIWKNDTFVRSVQIQDSAIFAVHMDMYWLFTGGWSKFINIQELSENELQVDVRTIASITCDSVITSLFSWRGKLFVGFSNKEIKVYYDGTK